MRNRSTTIFLVALVRVTVAREVVRTEELSAPVRVAALSPQAERAIQKGLVYLAEHQNADGSWGGQHRVAVTALSLMAYMVRGHLPDREPYGRAMTAGIDYLIKEGREGAGYLGKSMYEHGLATLALSEAWGMSTRSDPIRDLIKRAVDVILRAQNPQGGWRYRPEPRDADMSVTVMQIVALASAREAGILVPDAVIRRAIGYVRSCQDPGSGGFGYQGPRDPGFARSAAGVMSLLMCGDRSSDSVRRGLDYLGRSPQGVFEDERWFYYGHYYAMQAMYQAGEAFYQSWYPRIRDSLLQKQRQDGSWPEEYGTPMAILVLGVPYRFLPIYQR
jgi:hypothetical protein